MKSNLLQQLQDWYQQPLGMAFASMVQAQLKEVLPNLYGYFLLQLGLPQQQSAWLEESPIAHKFCLNANIARDDNISVISKYEELPFPEHSFDLVFLPHILELSLEPEAVLKEVTRVLMPEGHLLILGFNPYSLWSMTQLFKNHVLHQSVQWGGGKYFSMAKLSRILSELNYELHFFASLFYRPPINHAVCLQRLFFLETVGRLCRPYPAAGYLVIAKRKVLTLTPIKPQWLVRESLAEKSWAQPTTFSFISFYRKLDQ